MNGCFYLIFPVLIPILFGIIIKKLPIERKMRATFSVGGLFLVSMISVFGLLFRGEADFTLWKVTEKVVFAFSLDAVSRFYVLFVSVVWAFVGLYAAEYMEHDENDARFWRYYLISYGALMRLHTRHVRPR